MFKSQLEGTPQNFEATAIFVENIFDKIKKKRAESKLVSNYDFGFPDVNVNVPRSPPKQRKNAKRPVKVKKTSSPRKKTILKKPRVLKERVDKQKKQTPTKSPRKYTRRVSKVPATADIDDEEAAFILSSISQRSFDSFYSRQTSGGTNKIHIPLDGFSPSSTQNYSPSSSPSKNLAYYVMLDHNYWIVEPEVQPAADEKPIEPVQNTITFSITQTIPEAQPLQTEVQSDDKKTAQVEATVLKEVVKVEEAPVKIEKPEEKQKEVNNNLFPSSKEEEEFVKSATPKVENTAVKKRWLRQATSADMSTPLKKRKTAAPPKEPVKVSKKETIEPEPETPKVEEVKVEVVSEVKKEEVPDPVELPAPVEVEETKPETPKVEIDKAEKEEPESTTQTPKAVETPIEPTENTETIKKEEVADELPTFKEEPDEDDDKHWDAVMEFHRLQLEKLEKSNKRFADKLEDKSFQTLNSLTSHDHTLRLNSRFNSSRLPFAQSLLTRFDQVDLADPRRPLSTSLSLDTHQQPNDTPPFQRSISESTLTRKHRWGGNDVKATFNSFKPYTSFFKENTHYKEEPYSRTSYSSYRVQKSSWINNHHQDPVEQPWTAHLGHPTNNFALKTSLPFGTETTVKKFDPVIPDETIFTKKSITASLVSPIVKTKASVYDPRLNPSLNEIRREEVATPKKKVRSRTES